MRIEHEVIIEKGKMKSGKIKSVNLKLKNEKGCFLLAPCKINLVK